MSSSEILSIVALIISSTALLWSTLQLFHSYLGSNSGYTNINEKSMPGWAKFKKRRFLWDQFRFQVNFETPVLLVCPATNDKFPVQEAGGKKSNWHAFIGGDEKTDLIPDVTAQQAAIHTVHNERATWITLLAAIHQMEVDSRRWQDAQFGSSGPSPASPPPFSQHSLAVAIQRKQSNWDSMPSSITKPYATTTICHIIEIAAMLGLHWKEFDRCSDTFLAEGNGFVLRATRVTELGTVFTFQVCGKSSFQEDRIIPVDPVKELAFGFVSTIFRTTEDRRRLGYPVGEVDNMTTLQLGSIDELAETLVSLGCNTRTSRCIRDNRTRHGHLYPLAFELLGMLGKILHIKNSFFRVLPNPTCYHWNRQYFSLPELLQAYQKEISTDDADARGNQHLNCLQTQAENIERVISKTQPTFSAGLLSALHQALEVCDEFLTRQVSRKKVELVLRTHIQTVLSMLNETERGVSPDRPSGAASRPEPADDEPPFASLDTQPPEHKQDKLMEIYFSRVLPRINNSGRLPALTGGSELQTNIWCTLVFRSLCWLTLHDFHKHDKQIASMSELIGSRYPVYVL